MSEPILLSHSQRSSYLRCPNQFRLRRAGFPQTPSVALMAGSAFHEASETVDYELLSGFVPSVDEITDIWQELFGKQVSEGEAREPDQAKWSVAGRATKDKPNKEDVTWWFWAGADMVLDYQKFRLAEEERGTTIWQHEHSGGVLVESTTRPAVELSFDFEVGESTEASGDQPGVREANPGSMRIRGAIDRIMVDENGQLIIRDLKTNAQVPTDISQLGIYRVAVQRLFGVDVAWGDYYMARKGTTSMPEALGHYTEDLIAREYGYIATAKRLNLYPANPGQNCRSCDVAAGCSVVGGSEAENWLTAMPS